MEMNFEWKPSDLPSRKSNSKPLADLMHGGASIERLSSVRSLGQDQLDHVAFQRDGLAGVRKLAGDRDGDA